MRQGEASRTAVGAAGHRAAHQILERGLVFADPLAIPILGEDAEEALTLARERPERRPLRLFIAMRSRFAEDSARRAISEGVRQIVILGAGLDTFAYRLDGSANLRLFEIDHPATQAAKRRRLASAGIASPPRLAYVAHDFEGGGLTSALTTAGFDAASRAFVLWLGVTPYLTHEATFATLGELAGCPGGVEVVFDYANPREVSATEGQRRVHERMSDEVARVGEPFRGYLATAELHAAARQLGFTDIEDLDRATLVARYLPRLPTTPSAGPGGHVVRMTRRQREGPRPDERGP